jgi:bifunctional ADP-heptose synthase (sugar kinase/adenylyltransferase)
MENIGQLFRDFEKIKVGVIGDVMLDTYIWGEVERISPEAPVPIVSLHHRTAVRWCRKRGTEPSIAGCKIFKPNLKEVKEALNILLTNTEIPVLQDIHQALYQHLHHRISLITLSEKGVFYQHGESANIIPSHIRNVADVSGAGDTVIAVAALVYAVRKNVHLMAEIANIAGGLVCEEVGTAAISKLALLHECELLLS